MKEAVQHFAKAASIVHHHTPLTATANTTNHASHVILRNAGFRLLGATRRGRTAVDENGIMERKNLRPYQRVRHLPLKKARL
jgi:RimJ/RimL family protein N-acetyltransferase